MSAQYSFQWAARLAVLGLTTAALVACGGGNDEATTPVSSPTTVTVASPPATPSALNTSSGTTSSGTLNYLVYGSADVAAGSGSTASAQVVAVATANSFTTNVTFPAAAPFAGGLLINDAHSGSPSWPTDNTPGGSLVVLSGGGPFNMSWPSGNGNGLLAQGNFFVFCASGAIAPTVTAQTARSGAQVAISGNFSPMDNIAALYGKTFKRFDCAGTTGTTSFGDGQGNLTMTGDGLTLSQAQTVQAFSAAGYAPAAGQIIKRRAYSIVINGSTRYVVVALDNRGAPYASYASVLYQAEN